MSNSPPGLSWRLAGFYFFYFAFVGAFSPYWGLYLKSLRFDPWLIGVLMSLTQIMRIFAPGVWGWVADHTGRRAAIVRLAAMIGLISFSGVFISSRFSGLFVSLAIMSFFWSASLPLVEATTMSVLGNDPGRYSRVRLWGSIGFIFASTGFGYLLQYLGIGVLPLLVLITLAGTAVYAWQVPEIAPQPRHASSLALSLVVRQPAVLGFFLASFCMAFAHGPYYAFMSIYLEDLGYGKGAIGWFWTLGVVAEVAAFLLMPRLLGWLGLRTLFLTGLLLAVLRFFMIAWTAQYVVLLVLAQLLHAATFGTNHACSIALIHRFFPGYHQAKGQALYISASFGVGGTVGGLLAGALWSAWGAQWVFTLSAVVVLAGAAISWLTLRLEGLEHG